MRILHVNKFLYRRGGAESYLLDLAAAQQASGHEVSFFAMAHPDNLADPNDDLFPTRMELDPPPEGGLERLRTAARIVHRRDARAAMARILDRVRPDVVHLHNIYHQLSPSILAPITDRAIPSVMTLHDYKLVCPTYQLLDADGEICEACLPGRFRNAVRRRCNRGSLTGSALSAVESRVHRTTGAYDGIDVLACPSDFLRAKMVQGGIAATRLAHLTNFCDLSGIEAATEPGRGVLYAGRLSHEKGVDVLVEAARHLPQGLPITIAGDGPERAALEARADAVAPGRITFLGRISGAEVHRRMREAAVVVVPSRWYENQPMTILEAYGAGRPVVASRLGGLPELVDDGVTGALVAHDDPRGLAEAVRILALDPETAHAHGREARRRAEERFGLADHLDGVERLYARAASHREARTGGGTATSRQAPDAARAG
ncbi:glycosyltransferase [Nocardioides sp. GXZ039]|uniref:glycosyltransferase n=1 Tax=Nocardioides sp. GXZ039 TaxID=3136018 RepID=UPI0030F4A8B7